MPLNAWTREAGTQQARIEPTGWTAPEGTHVFVLGFDTPGHFELLNVGDYAEVSQTGTFTGGVGNTKLIRVKARLRPPSAMPSGLGWKFSLKLDGTERVSRVLTPARLRDCVDLAANVSKFAGGNHTVTLRVELVNV